MAVPFTIKVVTNGASVLVLCLLVLHGVSGCIFGHGCFNEKAAQSRKMLQNADLKEKNEIVKGPLDGSTSNTTGIKEKFVEWELRTAPSGPDPMHHNGASPKEPRTDHP